MIGNKKIIAVCMTRVQSISNNEYLSRLQKLAVPAGYKLLVFSSNVDYYNNDQNDEGAKSVYSLMNFDTIDAVIIKAEDFKNRAVFEEIVLAAREREVPVIVLKGSFEGCYSIENDYAEGFKRLMDHVVRDHGVTDTFFIAGRNDPENDPDSVRRIGCYKEVLERNGLDFSEELVDYGEYWNIPTLAVMERLLARRGKPPRAIFCANDYMAMSVLEFLSVRGYRVPEDCIVTGFDGVPEAAYTMPQLTTCREDLDSLAATTMDMLGEIFSGVYEPRVCLNSYEPLFTESCGCPYSGSAPREEARRQYAMAHESLAHEEFVVGWLSTAIEQNDMSAYMSLIPKLVLALGYMCLNSDTIRRIVENDESPRAQVFTDRLDIIPSVYSPYPLTKKYFDRRDMIPEPLDWAEDDSMYILSAINSGSRVYGYYAVRSTGSASDAYNITRSANALGIGFNAITSFYRQRIILMGLHKAALVDHVTGLANLKGTTKWFEELASDPENHKKCLTVSVYWMPKYKFIYENFGINEIEEAVCFVAENLKRANRENCFIGRVSEDEFLVINYYDRAEDIAPTINAATGIFYKAAEELNASGSKPYYLEVNAGCTELYPGWEGTLASFSKLAGNAMYINRLNGNMPERTVKKAQLPVESYKSFELLVEQNLFDYHFQPIVEAATGNIIAYEALMRPHRSIGMNPTEVIRTAEEYGRLDDIERATMFNVLKVVSERTGDFRGRKIFINSIPGHFLRGEEYDRFINCFRNYLDSIVIEITEGSPVSDSELAMIKGILSGRVPIAIDDYGTGHSNIVNLLRYSPEIIKVDRFLIKGIENDTNKQLFFRTTVEFAEMNGMKVLAEGVETAEELDCVISLGAHLIQGYYTGRPASEPLDKIPDPIRAQILKNAI